MDAPLDIVPEHLRQRNPPRWLVPSVLRQWGAGSPGYLTPMATYARDTKGVFAAVRQRWVTPIEARVRWRAPFDNAPSLPFQLGYFLRRAAFFAAKTLGLVRSDTRGLLGKPSPIGAQLNHPRVARSQDSVRAASGAQWSQAHGRELSGGHPQRVSATASEMNRVRDSTKRKG